MSIEIWFDFAMREVKRENQTKSRGINLYKLKDLKRNEENFKFA